MDETQQYPPYPLGPAARRIGISVDWLRDLCDRGVVPHMRDAGNRRLIAAEIVERLRREREARIAKAMQR